MEARWAQKQKTLVMPFPRTQKNHLPRDALSGCVYRSKSNGPDHGDRVTGAVRAGASG